MARKDGKDRGLFERPHGSGIWWICWFDGDGKKHRQKIGSKTLALDAYRKRKHLVKEEELFPELVAKKRRQQYLLVDAVNSYLEESKARKRSWKEDVRHGDMWSKLFPKTPLADIQTADIERWVRERQKQVAPATVNRSLAFLKHLYNRAMRDTLVDRNPVVAVRMMTENNARIRFMSDDEERHLCGAIQPDDWDIVQIAYKTGMRRSEQFLLKRTSVDLRTRVITIPRSKHGERRYIDMGDDVHAILTRILATHTDEWVFPPTMLAPKSGRRGGQFKPGDILAAQAWIARVFEKTAAKLGYLGLTWHSLRHTTASRLVMAGVDIVTVKEFMGHRNIATTLRYAHLSPSHKRAAAQKLNSPPARREGETDT